MKKLISLDTEDNSKGKVYIINFFDGENHATFTGKNARLNAQKWLFKQSDNFDLDIWSTNIGYDLQNLLGDNLHYAEIFYISSRIISAKIQGTKINFFDTLNHWKISVKEMGERIGLKKFETTSFNNIKYCQRDSEITWHFVNNMKSHYHNIGCELKPTIGSTAMRLFQNKYYKYPKKRIFTTKQIDFMLKGYYGGRTEIFFNKPIEGNIQYYDFNSLYPAMMLNAFPVLQNFKFTKKLNLENEGIAYVRVRSPDNSIPYLPHRTVDRYGLLFPIGTFDGHYTFFEIREAIKEGYKIEKVYNAFEFSGGSFYPFKDFVTDLYTKRLKAQKSNDTLLSDAYKLLMNNLYGKFAQGNEYTRLIPFDPKMKFQSGDSKMGNMVLKTVTGPYPIHTNVIWSAYVTAYGRHALYKAMKTIERENGLLIYCDTDSVVFESDKQIFKHSKELGELKLETIWDYAHFKLPKMYAVREKIKKTYTYKAKGVPKKYAEEFFIKEKVTFKRPYKIREVLRRNLSPKRKIKLKINFWDDIQKVSNKVYDKRMVKKDGSTAPIFIS